MSRRNDDFRCSSCGTLLFRGGFVQWHEHYFCNGACLGDYRAQFRLMAETPRISREVQLSFNF